MKRIRQDEKARDRQELKFARKWAKLLRIEYRKLVDPVFKYGDYALALQYTYIANRKPYLSALEELYTEVITYHYQNTLRKANRFRKNDDVIKRYIQDYLNHTGFWHAEEIDETSREIIRDMMQEAVDTKMSVNQFSRLVAKVIPELTTARAMTIVRTELTAAMNFGSLQALDDTGLIYTKTWLAAKQPKRTRPWHLAASGQTVPKDQPFIVNGEKMRYPGDSLGSADNVVRCRCSMSYDIKDEDLGL